jgi:hypothetical protein
MNCKINDCALSSIFLWQTLGQKYNRRESNVMLTMYVVCHSNGVLLVMLLEMSWLNLCLTVRYLYRASQIFKASVCLHFALLHLIWGPSTWQLMGVESLYVFCRLIPQLCGACRWSVTWARCVDYIFVYITLSLFLSFWQNIKESTLVLWLL